MNETPKGKIDHPNYENTLRCLREAGLISKEKCSHIQNDYDLYISLKEIDLKLEQELTKYNPKSCDLQVHMEELHNYNTIKDATQSLIGSISIQTGKSVTEMHKQFDLCDSL